MTGCFFVFEPHPPLPPPRARSLCFTANHRSLSRPVKVHLNFSTQNCCRYTFSSKESNEAVLVFNRSAGSAAAAMKRKAPQATKKTAAVPAKAKKKKTK